MSGVEFEKILHATLRNDEGLNSMLQQRVFAIAIPEKTPLPCITFQRLSGHPLNTLTGQPDMETVLIQIDCWGRTFTEAKTVGLALRQALATAPFHCVLDEDRDLHDPATHHYRVSSDFRCWHKE